MALLSSLSSNSLAIAAAPCGLRGTATQITFGKSLRTRWGGQSTRGVVNCRSEITTAGATPSQAASERTTVVSSGADQLEISRVINGMWQVSGGWGKIDPGSAVDAMLKYTDAGFTTFDMADHCKVVEVGQTGASFSCTGTVTALLGLPAIHKERHDPIAKDGPAELLYGSFINKVRRERGDELASKVQGLTKWVPSPTKMTRAWVETNIDRSRKRMDVKTLDMLQFHWWDYADSGYLDALKHLADLKEEGKIKTLALTNFDTKRLAIILENGIPVASNQVQNSLVDMRPQQRMAELCQLTGVKLITYGTVMGGLLSEKFFDVNISIPFAGPPLDTPSLNKYKRMVDAWGGWKLFQELLREVKTVSVKHGVSISTVAVRYILDQQSVGGSMIGVRLGLSQHLSDSQAIFKVQLDDEDRQRIEAVTSKGKDLLGVIGDCGDEYRRA